MKAAISIAMAGCLAIAAASVQADNFALRSNSFSLTQFPDHILPVLVQVDSHGKVTDVSPAVELSPRYDRLLRSTLDEMITHPASYKGRAIASQFVIKLGLRATARGDGKYEASFFYVAADPVPTGQWIWQREDGHRLALVNRNALGGEIYRYRPPTPSVFIAPRSPAPPPRTSVSSQMSNAYVAPSGASRPASSPRGGKP